MGVPKGTDNFKKYRAHQIEYNIRAIKTALAKIRKLRIVHESDNRLIADVSSRTEIDRRTLKRNKTYLNLIIHHLHLSGGAVTADKVDMEDVATLKNLLIEADMEIGCLNSELKQVKGQLAEKSKSEGVLTETEAHAAFANTVMVVREIVERVNSDAETLVVDVDRVELRDLSLPRGRQVFLSGARLAPFVAAYVRLLEQEQ